jgi:hypothetical protein
MLLPFDLGSLGAASARIPLMIQPTHDLPLLLFS